MLCACGVLTTCKCACAWVGAQHACACACTFCVTDYTCVRAFVIRKCSVFSSILCLGEFHQHTRCNEPTYLPKRIHCGNAESFPKEAKGVVVVVEVFGDICTKLIDW